MTLPAILQQVLDRIEQRPNGVVVFDLDGTLFDNRPRTCAILHALGERWKQRDEQTAARLQSVSPSDLVYSIVSNLQRLGVNDPEGIALGLEFWRQHFFQGTFIPEDRPYAGAVPYVTKCYEAGAAIVYFTGRDLPNMGPATLTALQRFGFPIGLPGTELVLKPDPALNDFEYKRTTTPLLGRVGRVLAGFDNEPGNCNELRRCFPEATVVWMKTLNHPDAPPLDADSHALEHFEA